MTSGGGVASGSSSAGVTTGSGVGSDVSPDDAAVSLGDALDDLKSDTEMPWPVGGWLQLGHVEQSPSPVAAPGGGKGAQHGPVQGGAVCCPKSGIPMDAFATVSKSNSFWQQSR
jgi:hypothetical protein